MIVGNTLTGEFARANVMRLRWPFVRRTVATALQQQGWDDDRLATFLDGLEEQYKAPFPAIDEDTLAGGLSNTIAGRICNYFDLDGGGYTVDGACSSSLLSVATACRALLDGDLDVAVAGGVDLSIDPFEIVGFAKTGALARDEMRVYDRHSNGFWPGEGCGMVVLMREADALAAGHRSYATIAGWGISSDGKGGITRPEVNGYQLALRRAYERAGFGIESVPLFEGHGTGTAVGDATELTALSEARRQADPTAPPAVITSIKGMIGHTKAAAGVAGLIKAALAVHHQVLPPALGCVDPHELLTRDDATLRVLRTAEPWPDGQPVRAGITAMGFGGINTHVVLERAGSARRVAFDTRTARLATSVQDAELFLVDGSSRDELRDRLRELRDYVPTLAQGQLADVAATLHDQLADRPYRAAVVVSSPTDAQQRLRRLCELLDSGETRLVDGDGRSFLGHVGGAGRLGYLFPGQGAGRGTSGGALRRRLTEVDQVFRRADLPVTGDMVATALAQPRIVTGSRAGLAALDLLGLDATVAVGHSLGELSALHWAGAMDDETLLRVTRARGRTMTEHSSSGVMASVNAGPERVSALVAGVPVVIAGYNGPEQTVVAGTEEAVQAALGLAADAGIGASLLRVSHAFHSPLVAPAADAFAGHLTRESFGPVRRRVVSTVTGETLPAETDLRALLRRQITDPVLFAQAVALAAKDIDLFVEVGPGRILSGLAGGITDVPAVALDTDDESLRGLLRVAAAAFVVGAAHDYPALFDDRLRRPLVIGAEQHFFASPCEQAPLVDLPVAARADRPAPADADGPVDGESTVQMLRRLAAERAELPLAMVHGESRLLDDLHLSSITVGQIINEASRLVNVPPAQAPTNFATATVEELAVALDELSATGQSGDHDRSPAVTGAATWTRAFTVDREPAAAPVPVGGGAPGHWQVFATEGHPLAAPLRHALERAGVDSGVLVCLPPECAEEDLELALAGAKQALAGPAGTRFVLVQGGRGATGLAKTLRLEAPQLRVTVVDTPAVPEAVDRVVAEVGATTGYQESHYDDAGTRRLPVLRALPVRASRTRPALDDTDVLLVTGGGKGITAECALAVAEQTGARLGLLGRSDPAEDTELAENLRRMAARGVTLHYTRADVTDAGQVADAVAEVRAALGPVTAVLHGAGRNEPAALTALDAAAVRRTFAPKLDGLRAVLAAVDPGQLRLLVTFGSIIGRAGLRGEAHYATANDWLAGLTEETGRRLPRCRALCLEWSVWSGVGMGERLSVVESLSREGVAPISPDQGVEVLLRLLADPDVPPVVVVSGRAEGIDTLRYDRPTLPLLRFVDKPLVALPGCRTGRRGRADRRHRPLPRRPPARRQPALPGGLRDGGDDAGGRRASPAGPTVPVVEQVEFPRPIVVPPDGSTIIRVAATVTDDAVVQVAIRSAETGFATDHFRARLRFTDTAVPDGPPGRSRPGSAAGAAGTRAGPLRRVAVPGRPVPTAAPVTTGPPPGTWTPRWRWAAVPPGSPASSPATCCSATPAPGTPSCTATRSAYRTPPCCRSAWSGSGRPERGCPAPAGALLRHRTQPRRRHLRLRHRGARRVRGGRRTLGGPAVAGGPAPGRPGTVVAGAARLAPGTGAGRRARRPGRGRGGTATARGTPAPPGPHRGRRRPGPRRPARGAPPPRRPTGGRRRPPGLGGARCRDHSRGRGDRDGRLRRRAGGRALGGGLGGPAGRPRRSRRADRRGARREHAHRVDPGVGRGRVPAQGRPAGGLPADPDARRPRRLGGPGLGSAACRHVRHDAWRTSRNRWCSPCSPTGGVEHGQVLRVSATRSVSRRPTSSATSTT